jgi:hypothetical protein
MNILWQWHNVTAYGDDAIIEKARKYALADYVQALSRVARGVHPINNINDAIDYFYATESGAVKDEIVPNEIVCEE